MPQLAILIPCYNEARVLPVTEPAFLMKLLDLIAAGSISDDSRILFVDDGSKDATWDLIGQFHEQDIHVAGIQQSRNRGKKDGNYHFAEEKPHNAHTFGTMHPAERHLAATHAEQLQLHLQEAYECSHKNERTYKIYNSRNEQP